MKGNAVARPPGKEEKTAITVYLTAAGMDDLNVLQQQLGAGMSKTGTVEWYLRDAANRVRGNHTKEPVMERLDAMNAQLARQSQHLQMCLYLLWSLAGSTTVKLEPEELQRVRTLIQELDAAKAAT